MNEKTQKYGFLTAISMVVGIVIGSGIFFKADDILSTTGGSVTLGLIAFILVGIGVLFGTLVIAKYAQNNSSEGGVIAYAQDVFGLRVASYISWFFIAVYFPCLIAILGYVTAMYLGQFLGIDNEAFRLLGAVFVITAAFISNIFSKRLGGIVQSVSMIIKLIPLLVIGIVGLLFFNTSQAPAVSADTLANKNFLSALISIAFAFDGWIVVTSISKDLKNPTKLLPKVLGVGIILVTVVYCLYFVGVSNLVGPQTIITAGDGYTTLAAEAIAGNFGAHLILLFVMISVYGGTNGMVLAYLRLPQALVHKRMMKNILNIEKDNEKVGFSNGSIIFTISFVIFYLIFQGLISTGVIFSGTGFDLSSMPIIFNYVIYSALYIMVFKVVKKVNFELVLFSVVAFVISIIIIYGALQTNALLYIGVCFVMTGLGFFVIEKK
ncbi:MAG: APC family permease [Mycoplasmatales bacterium]